jgi:hypothetical protein
MPHCSIIASFLGQFSWPAFGWLAALRVTALNSSIGSP